MSLAELAHARIQLRPPEAVAVVIEICRRCGAGELHGVPRPGIIRLTRDGTLTVEGPTTTGDDVARAAQLLKDLLPPFDAAPEYRASGGLRLVIARALGELDVPPYASLNELCAALTRFANTDLASAATSVVQAWERAHASHDLAQRDPAALTISDIRRARRATGLTLGDVSAACGVPRTQLRNLEWGYVRDWRADADGRDQVIGYARAAGLDERLVLSVAWPLIESAPTAAEEQPVVAMPEPAASSAPASAAAASASRRWAKRLAFAAAIVVFALIGVVIALLSRPKVELVSADMAPPLLMAPEPVRHPAPAPLEQPAPIVVRPAVAAVSAVARPRADAAVERAQRRSRRPVAAPRRAPERKPLLQRELLRIVIR